MKRSLALSLALVLALALSAQAAIRLPPQDATAFEQPASGLSPSSRGLFAGQNEVAAVSVAFALRGGSTSSAVESSRGYSFSHFTPAQPLESPLHTARGDSSPWQIGANDKVAAPNGAQDPATDPPAGSIAVPEPASFVIWGMISLAGAVTVIGKKAIRGRRSAC
jgi:hypothetical protein